jgi:hypothetical protein
MVFDFDIANGVLRAHAFRDDDKWGRQHLLQGINDRLCKICKIAMTGESSNMLRFAFASSLPCP